MSNKSWSVRKIGTLGKVVTGKTPSTANNAFFGGDTPFITIPDLGNSVFIHTSERTLSEFGVKAVKGSLLPKGAVMMSCIATIGKCGITTKPSVTNQQINSVICNSDVDPRFLYYTFTQLGRELDAAGGGGSVYTNVSKARFSDIEIPLPPLPEQRAIADVLGALDDKIELNRRMNHTLEQMARALFERMKDEGGRMNGWKAGKLGDVAENIRRGAIPQEIHAETAYIGLEHMPRKSIALTEWGQAEDVTSNKFWFKKGEILFGKLRPYFHKVGVAPIDGVCSTDILVIAPKKPEYFGFVLGHVSSEELVKHADAASTGTKMPRASWGDIERYEVEIPPITEAAKLTEQIEPLIQKIHLNIEQSRALAALRDALLPRLMSGEIRVKAEG